MNFYFTYESRVTLKSSTLFITVKTIAKLNPEHRSKSSGKFEIKVKKKLAVVVRSPDSIKFGPFQVVVLPRTVQKCTKNYNAQ